MHFAIFTSFLARGQEKYIQQGKSRMVAWIRPNSGLAINTAWFFYVLDA